MNIFRYFASNT